MSPIRTGDGGISHGIAAASVSLPLLGLLFFSVPWEADPRTEKAEKRFERLSAPREAFLVNLLVSVTQDSALPSWDGLFPWEQADFVRLKSKRPPETEAPLDDEK